MQGAVLDEPGTAWVERAAPIAVRRRPFTREEYYQMAQTGVFRPDERLELIEGTIVPMAPQGPEHASVGDYLRDLVSAAFGSGYCVRSQRPLALGQASDPEPDIAVVPGSYLDYLHTHPTTALLVIEVSDTTLAFDRSVKGSLYAAAGIPDYWIVNVTQRLLEVYREPGPDPVAPLGFSYTRSERLASGAQVAPLSAPAVVFRVADLVPL